MRLEVPMTRSAAPSEVVSEARLGWALGVTVAAGAVVAAANLTHDRLFHGGSAAGRRGQKTATAGGRRRPEAGPRPDDDRRPPRGEVPGRRDPGRAGPAGRAADRGRRRRAGSRPTRPPGRDPAPGHRAWSATVRVLLGQKVKKGDCWSSSTAPTSARPGSTSAPASASWPRPGRGRLEGRGRRQRRGDDPRAPQGRPRPSRSTSSSAGKPLGTFRGDLLGLRRATRSPRTRRRRRPT